MSNLTIQELDNVILQLHQHRKDLQTSKIFTPSTKKLLQDICTDEISNKEQLRNQAINNLSVNSEIVTVSMS